MGVDRKTALRIQDRRQLAKYFRRCLRKNKSWVEIFYPKEIRPGLKLWDIPCERSVLNRMVWAVLDGVLRDPKFLKLVDDSVNGLAKLVEELGLQNSMYDHDGNEMSAEYGADLSVHGHPKLWFRVWPAELPKNRGPYRRIFRLLGSSKFFSPRLQYVSGFDFWKCNQFFVTIPLPGYAARFDELFSLLFEMIGTPKPK